CAMPCFRVTCVGFLAHTGLPVATSNGTARISSFFHHPILLKSGQAAWRVYLDVLLSSIEASRLGNRIIWSHERGRDGAGGSALSACADSLDRWAARGRSG